MIYKSDLKEQIYKLERRINELEYALLQANVFNYDTRSVYSTQYGRVLINEVKTK